MNTWKELAELRTKLAKAQENKDQKDNDREEEENMELSLTNDSAWAKSHFKSHRVKQLAEIDGLIGAKNFLAAQSR